MAGDVKHAVAVWREDTVFDVTVDSGHTVVTDGSAKLGQSPIEMLLTALAGCTGADVSDILRKKRQDVTRLEVRVTGERSETHPRVYTNVEILFVVTGRDIQPEAVRRAIELSREKYCSVTAMFRGTATVTCQHEIHSVATAPA